MDPAGRGLEGSTPQEGGKGWDEWLQALIDRVHR